MDRKGPFRSHMDPKHFDTRRGTKTKAPTVIGSVPVLVPDGRAVGMGRTGHQSFLWDQASSALVVVIHH